MSQLYHLDQYCHRTSTGLTIAEMLEFASLERSALSLTEWDAYTMQPISEREKRWAYLFRKYIDAEGTSG